MADRSLSEGLASHYAALEFDQIPADIIDSAKLHIIDSLGCLLAGSRLHAGKLAYELAVANNGANTNSRLFGSQRWSSLLDAVEAMSVAAHCGEMDDIHSRAGTCIGALVLPALLALAEKYGGSGRNFIEATIAGYETIIRVGLSIDAPK